MNLSEECKDYKVYIHTFPNGKKYIGITRQDVTQRWGLHGSGYKGQRYLWDAIQKYGWDNVVHEVVMYGLLESEALAVETALIKQFKTYDHNYGYNILIEPNEFIKYTGNKLQKQVICLNTLEIFDSIKIAAKKYDIQATAISKACRGVIEYCGKDEFGHGMCWSFYSPNEVYVQKFVPVLTSSVICLNTLTRYASVYDAVKSLKMSNVKGLLKVCKGRSRYCGVDEHGTGLQWSIYIPGIEYTKIEPKVVRKKVICLNTLEVFDSALEASKKFGIPNYSILRHCERNTQYGSKSRNDGFKYLFRFYDPNEEYTKVASKDLKRPVHNSKKVLCVEIGEVFRSIAEASDKLKVSKYNISRSCSKNGVRSRVTEYTFRYVV